MRAAEGTIIWGSWWGDTEAVRSDERGSLTKADAEDDDRARELEQLAPDGDQRDLAAALGDGCELRSREVRVAARDDDDDDPTASQSSSSPPPRHACCGWLRGALCGARRSAPPSARFFACRHAADPATGGGAGLELGGASGGGRGHGPWVGAAWSTHGPDKDNNSNSPSRRSSGARHKLRRVHRRTCEGPGAGKNGPRRRPPDTHRRRQMSSAAAARVRSARSSFV